MLYADLGAARVQIGQGPGCTTTSARFANSTCKTKWLDTVLGREKDGKGFKSSF